MTMGTIVNAGGTTTSFSKTPQAGDDWYNLSEDSILSSSYYSTATKILTLDVMGNDLGGNAKSLFSIDDSEGNQITDLTQTDLLTSSKYSAWEMTDDGNWIRIANGKIEFKLADPDHANDFNYARDVNSLGANEAVDDKFTYAIKLGNGTLSYATVHINIAGANDLASISGTSTGQVVEAGGVDNANPGTSTTGGTLSVSDADSGQATFAPVASASLHGTYGEFTFSAATGEWTYTLDNTRAATQGLGAGVPATDTLVVTSLDGTASRTITVDITGSNDAPKITSASDVAGSVSEGDDGAAMSASGQIAVSDVDIGDTHGFSVTTAAAHGTASIDADGTWHYAVSDSDEVDALAEGEHMSDSFTVTVDDGHGGTATQVVTIDIVGTNDAPTGSASAELAAGTEDVPYVVHASDLLKGFTDVDGDTLKVANLAADHGMVTDNGDGTFTITPDANYNGTVALTYTVDDGHTGGTIAATQSFTLAAQNDPATITGDKTGAITEDASPNTVSGDLQAADIDNPADSWTAASGTTAHGSFTVDAAGVWVFTLDNANAQVQALNASSTPLVDTFTVTTIDGTSQQVSITINGADEPATVVTTAAVFTGAGDPNDFDDLLSTSTKASAVDFPGSGNSNGADTIHGSNQIDTILLGTGNDAAYGHGGNDTIKGEGGADVSLYGQAGDDLITGGQGGDTMYGGSGDDQIFGYEGPVNTANNTQANDGGDTIYGGSGSDRIYGQFGDDRIVGGYGADELWGHGGADTFAFVSVLDRGDVIKDFSNADGDLLDLTRIDANSLNGAGTNEAFAWGGTSATANGLWYQYDASNDVTHVYGDTDGNVGTAEIWFDLAGNIDLNAAQSAGHVLL